MRVTATEAKNRFGSLCAQAQHAPVFVEKAGRIDAVMLSAEHQEALRTTQNRTGLITRKKAFEAVIEDWIRAQNERFEAHGIPGADLRPWQGDGSAWCLRLGCGFVRHLMRIGSPA